LWLGLYRIEALCVTYNIVHKSKEVVLPQSTKIIHCRGVNNMERKEFPNLTTNG